MAQGEEAEPQVLDAEQTLAELEAEQTSFLTLGLVCWPAMKLVRRSGKANRPQEAAR
jgi:hypothetical protein